MHPLLLVATAIALSADACAVAAARGLCAREASWRQAALMGGAFGLFQALMPILGWAAGSAAHQWIQRFDHWLAFGLLLLIGLKMLWEAVQRHEDCPAPGWPRLPALTLLAIATSIDALAVGISFAALEIAPWWPAAVIGGITFVASTASAHFARALGSRFGRAAECVGGLVLCAIGTTILVQHLRA